jgi:DNA-binding GntR family transcriptional regulator
MSWIRRAAVTWGTEEWYQQSGFCLPEMHMQHLIVESTQNVSISAAEASMTAHLRCVDGAPAAEVAHKADGVIRVEVSEEVCPG